MANVNVPLFGGPPDSPEIDLKVDDGYPPEHMPETMLWVAWRRTARSDLRSRFEQEPVAGAGTAWLHAGIDTPAG